jgi:hypothetical protein
MIFESEGESDCRIDVGGINLEVVKEFNYLGSVLSNDGLCKAEIEQRVMKGRSVCGAIKKLVNQRSLSLECGKALYVGLLVPTLLYSNETLVMYERDISRLQAVEMSLLRNMIGVTRWDRHRNEEVRDWCGVNVSMAERVARGRLRWLGHVVRMNDERWPKIIFESNVIGNRRVGRPRTRWLDCVEGDCEERGINDFWEAAHDRSAWRRMIVSENDPGMLDQPPVLLLLLLLHTATATD